MFAKKKAYGTTIQNSFNHDYGSSESIKTKQKMPMSKENFSSINNKLFSPLIRQVTLSFGILMLIISSGMTSGYSAILLPQLMKPNSTLPISQEEASWIASSAPLTMALGCLIIGPFMTYSGRKVSSIISTIVAFVGWVCINQASGVFLIIIGRILTGLCAGALGPVGTVYIAECSDPKYRGFLLGGVSLSISLGIFISHIIGTYFTWQQTSFVCCLCPCVALFILTFVPESPTYLASKNKFSKAEYSFKWYRGTGSKAMTEMNISFQKYKSIFASQQNADSEIIMKENGINDDTKLQSVNNSPLNHNVSFREYITKSYFWKPFLIMNVFFIVTQFSGVNAIVFYSVTILQESLGSNVDSYLGMFVIDQIRNIMSIIACVILRKFTRRSLAIYSTLGTAVSLIFLSLFIYFTEKHNSFKEYGFISLIALIVYICFISIGLVPLPWVIVGEIFPSAVRNVGTSLSSCLCFIYLFLVVKTTPALFENFGSAGVYGIYGSFAVVGTLYFSKYLPETKDKTLEDIEEYFMTK